MGLRCKLRTWRTTSRWNGTYRRQRIAKRVTQGRAAGALSETSACHQRDQAENHYRPHAYNLPYGNDGRYNRGNENLGGQRMGDFATHSGEPGPGSVAAVLTGCASRARTQGLHGCLTVAPAPGAKW